MWTQVKAGPKSMDHAWDGGENSMHHTVSLSGPLTCAGRSMAESTTLCLEDKQLWYGWELFHLQMPGRHLDLLQLQLHLGDHPHLRGLCAR